MSPMAESRTACRKTVMPGKLLRIVSSSLGQPASVWASGLGSATFAGLDRELGEPRLDRTDLPDRHLCAGPAVVDLWVEWRQRLRWLRRGHPSPDFLERRRARHSSRRLFVPAEPGTNRGPSARRLCAHRLGQRSALAVSRLRHVVRPAGAGLVETAVSSIRLMFGSLPLVEFFFAYPGLGRLLLLSLGVAYGSQAPAPNADLAIASAVLLAAMLATLEALMWVF